MQINGIFLSHNLVSPNFRSVFRELPFCHFQIFNFTLNKATNTMNKVPGEALVLFGSLAGLLGTIRSTGLVQQKKQTFQEPWMYNTLEKPPMLAEIEDAEIPSSNPRKAGSFLQTLSRR